MKDRSSLLIALCIGLSAAACSDDTGDAADCASGTEWIGGDHGSGDMYPGQDCNECHIREDEGPKYKVAGTVFAEVDERDDCFGLEGMIVEITDANGAVTRMTSRESGNFYKESATIATPYMAKVITPDGTEVPMVTPQTDLQCNNCHTQGGEQGASGRIFVP